MRQENSDEQMPIEAIDAVNQRKSDLPGFTTAMDGGRDCSRQSSAFPPSMEVRSVAIGREPMRPMKLSNFEQVKLLARISKSGDAMPQPGDLIGVIEQVTLSDKSSHTIVINSQIK